MSAKRGLPNRIVKRALRRKLKAISEVETGLKAESRKIVTGRARVEELSKFGFCDSSVNSILYSC